MTNENPAARFALKPPIFIWAVVIFLLAEPFALQLEGIDPSGPATQVAKPFALYLRLAVLGLVGAYVVQRGALSRVIRVAVSAPLLLALAVLALASAAWAAEPLPTILAGIEFLGTIFCLCAVIASQSKPDSARSVLIALSICVFASIVWALLLPHYGQHDRADIYQGGHVGKWRGIYRHKNILGQISGITVGVWLSPSGKLMPRYYRYAAIAGGVLCLAFAQSASGVLIALAGFGLGFVVFRLRGLARASGLAAGIVACGLLLGGGSELLSAILVAMGRSPTFSGRTYLWEAALTVISNHWFVGYGLVGTHDPEVMDVFSAISGEVHDAHNSYLELAIALGVVGLLLHVSAIIYAMAKRTRGSSRPEVTLGRQAAVVIIVMWLIAATVEAAPFMPGTTVEAFGLFAVLWLSAPQSARSGRGAQDEKNGGKTADLSVTPSGSRSSPRRKTFLDLDD